jgi:dihydropteroate synthase
LNKRVQLANSAGIATAKLIVDPGIGFGKNVEHNLALIRSLSTFRDLGAAVLCGPSRKAFIGKLTNIADPKERDAATIGAVCMASSLGADIVRVHDVKNVVQALKIVDALREKGR